MGILNDLMDLVRDVSQSKDDFVSMFTNARSSSLSRMANKGTLQFPVIVSKSLDLETCTVISKALEKKFASFAQITLSMDPNYSPKEDKNISNFLRKFHQNTDTKTEFSDVITFLNDVSEESVMFEDLNGNVFLYGFITEGTDGGIISSNRDGLFVLEDAINLEVVNDKFKPDSVKINSRLLSVTEANDVESERQYNLDMAKTLSNTSHTEREEKEIITKSGDPITKVELPRDVLKWEQVTKLNDLVPTHLHIRLASLDANGSITGHIEFILGIKATLHAVSSDDIIKNLEGASQSSDKVFNFIRWTTGEITFVKDFLLNIKDLKGDAMRKSSGSSYWWSALKRRKALAKIKNKFFLSKKLLPNTTLCVSMEEVEYLKNEYGYDLMEPLFIDRVMSTYFLLAFVVVDNSTQVAHFMFDGQKNFMTQTLSSLKKDNDNKDDFKQMLKLVNRI